MTSPLEQFVDNAHKQLYPLWASLSSRYPNVPFDGVVGLVRVENASIKPTASRFEPHVYTSIVHVKQGGKSTAFPGFNGGKYLEAIKKYPLDSLELKSIASSWGLGQIMGYHFIGWGIAPEQYMKADLKTSLEHLMKFYTQALPQAQKHSLTNTYEALLRIWNTGSATGTTYSPYYVDNALAAARMWSTKYGRLLKQAESPTQKNVLQPREKKLIMIKEALLDVVKQVEDLVGEENG